MLRPLDSWDSEATWQTFEGHGFHTEIYGVELQKCEQDLDRYEELIEMSQPDLVIETGTREGGSALWFAEHGLQVITIDVNPSAGQPAQQTGRFGSKIGYVVSSSIKLTATAMFDIAEQCVGKRVMVSLDSDHHNMHVQAEMAILAGLVTPGCYLVVEDGCFDMWGDRGAKGGAMIPNWGGPLAALNASGIEHTINWRRDVEIEGKHKVSHSPAGWWRRND